MTNNFWEGFEKQAALGAVAAKALGWGQKALKGVGEFTGVSQLGSGAAAMNKLRQGGQIAKAAPGAKGTLLGYGGAPGSQRAFGAAKKQLVTGGQNLGRVGAGAGAAYLGGKMLGGGQQAPVQQTFY